MVGLATVTTVAAQAPSNPPVDPGVAWTATFDEPNRPLGEGGEVVYGVVGAAAGGVCTAVSGTTVGGEHGVAVARYEASGAQVWGVSVPAWATTDTAPSDVAAVGDDCVVVASVTADRVDVARVGAGGVEWVRTVEFTDNTSTRAYGTIEADGVGGVWVGQSVSDYVGPGSVLIHLGPDGEPAARVVFPASENRTRSANGIQALVPVPDGRLLALVNAEAVALVGAGGDYALTPFGDDFVATSLALNGTGADSGVIVLGTTAGDEAEVRRLRLDGTTAWSTTLGPSAERGNASVGSDNIAGRDGAVFAIWQTAAAPRLARLGGTSGDIVWSVDTAAPIGARPDGLIADAEGVVFTSDLGGYWSAHDLAGAVRWGEPLDTPTPRAPGTLVPCASGGSCAFNQGTLTARSAAGIVLWSVAFDEGLVPDYVLTDLALAPDGGVYVTGTAWDEDFGEGLFVARVAPSGAIVWSTVVDTEGAAFNPRLGRGWS